MTAVKIPGAESIEQVAPARDPGVTASPDAFGAQIGVSEQHFGDALNSLGAHLYKKLQNETSDTWVQTHNIDSAVEFTKAQYANRAAFPQGDQDGGTAATDDMRRRLQEAKDTVTARTTQRLGAPTPDALSRINSTFAGRAQDALVQTTTFGYNQQVIAKQTVLTDNVALLGSRVLAGQMPLEDALKSVDANAEGGKPLYTASQLVDQKEKWQQTVVDAAIKNRYDAGDREGGDAIATKYYGAVPKINDSKAAGVASVANNLGIAPRDLAAVMSYETGGRFDPNMKGGKGGNYQGLIQFGPEERAKYGVKPGMTFQEQLPAVENFLRDRGVKPGMGLAQIYSVVNAGSLDANGQPRWAASDGNGNVASHVQNIQRDHYANADKFLAGAARAGTKVASADGSVGGGDDGEGASADTPVLPNVEKANYWRGQSHSVGVDIERQDRLQRIQTERASKDAENEYLKDIFSEQPKATVQGIMNDDRLSVPAKLQLRAVAERQFKDDPLAQRSQQSTMGLIDRMRRPDGDPDKITNMDPIIKAYTDGNLSRPDFEFAKKVFTEDYDSGGNSMTKLKTAFVKNAGDAIGLANLSSSMGGGAGTFQRYNFERYVDQRVQEYRDAKKNPMALFDPLSNDYLGKLDATGRPAILKPFLKDLQTDARDKAAEIATPASPSPNAAANRQRLDEWVRSQGGFRPPAAPPTAPTSE